MTNLNHIEVTHGTEGPRHDPYSYEEITVHGRNGPVTLHTGLAVWCRGQRSAVSDTEADAYVMFTRLTGMTFQRAMRAYRRQEERPLREHNARCKGRDFECVGGYPGEYLTMCGTCGDVVDYSLNRSEIE